MCSLLCNQFSTLFITVACGSRCCEILYSLAKLPNFISFLIAILLSKQAHTHATPNIIVLFGVPKSRRPWAERIQSKTPSFFLSQKNCNHKMGQIIEGTKSAVYPADYCREYDHSCQEFTNISHMSFDAKKEISLIERMYICTTCVGKELTCQFRSWTS